MSLVPQQLPSSRLQVLSLLPNQQKLGLMLAVAAIVALVAGLWMWGQTPDYRVLYSNLSDRDGGSIIASLQQMNVPYKFAEGGGALLLPANQVHEVRLRLASQGLPRGSLVGFELMENQKLGVSQFLEQVNYQRAQEGELARSIQSLAAVQGARVHLAMAKPSVFAREQQKPGASVLLNLYPGKTLDAAQVSAIVHLVSSSVPDMPVKNVTVVDQQGNLLSANNEGTENAPLDPSQLKYIQQIEQSYVKRIEAILAPITGASNVRAQVAADVDFSQSENVAEIHKPNQNPTNAAVRSQQSTEATSSGQGAGGVPGALSNQPPAPASAPVNAPAGAPAAGGNPVAAAPVNLRKDSTVNYEVDKTIRHTRQQVGSIKRLSVAVVVNHRKITDSAGKTSFKPLAEAEMQQINGLVKEAMGFNQERGDSLNVANSAFTAGEAEAVLPEIPFWKRPETFILAKEVGKHLLIAAVVLYLLLGVLRPLLKHLAQARDRAALIPALEADGGMAVESAGQQAALGYEHKLQLAKQLARQDPKVVANVVKNWVAGDER
ncbi:MAG: flagellar M-ring protein FliF [Sulfuricella sp.]|nr:flagellar M-ring protein FliF [Sulfuricella sp.]